MSAQHAIGGSPSRGRGYVDTWREAMDPALVAFIEELRACAAFEAISDWSRRWPGLADGR